ncbi:MAG TPA: cytochrome c family protein, partial [Patescibacteria group bacterium]|nr:cytochrome c family protein [Patescibacteria group bacterium]
MGITLQKIAGAVLLALILVIGLNMGIDALFPKPASPQHMAAVAPKAAPQPAASEPAAAAASPERPLAQRLASASAEKGQEVTKKCASCHTFTDGGGTRVGPNLYGVVGRPKGSMAGFAYSDAVKGLGGTWTYEDLDKFLTKPSAFAPGTKMGFPGLPSGDDRANAIAYLRSISPKAPPP